MSKHIIEVTVSVRYDEESATWDWASANDESDDLFETEAEALADARRYFA